MGAAAKAEGGGPQAACSSAASKVMLLGLIARLPSATFHAID
jgi:hypothetical protein